MNDHDVQSSIVESEENKEIEKKKLKNKKKKEKAKQKKQALKSQAPFYEWLQSRNVIVDRANIYDFADTGRGMRSTKDIKEGTLVFSIPKNLFLSIYSAKSSDLKPVFKKFTDLSNDNILAIHLMFEKSCESSSFWKAYLPFIPDSYTNTIFFSFQELKELVGSNLFDLTQNLWRQIESDYDSIFPKLFSNFSNLFKNKEEFSLEKYKWALATIWSRSFDIKMMKSSEQLTRVLPPFADMFNHSITAVDTHGYNHETESLECRIGYPVEKDQQIFINYGRFPNIKLLQLYGFVIEGNPYDVVHIWCPMSESAPKYEEKRNILKRKSVTNETAFELRMNDPLPKLLLTALRIQRADDLDSMSEKDWEMPVEHELLVLVSLENALQDMLNRYRTTKEEDEKLLQQKDISDKLRFAIILRSSEKSILTNSINHIRGLIEQIQ